MSLYNPDSVIGDFILRVWALNNQPATAWRSPRTKVFPRINWYPPSLYPYGDPGINKYGHRTYPGLSRPAYGILMVHAAPIWPVVLPTMLGLAATDVFPTVAGKQYQSAISGQPTVSDPNLVFNKGQGWSYFKF